MRYWLETTVLAAAAAATATAIKPREMCPKRERDPEVVYCLSRHFKFLELLFILS